MNIDRCKIIKMEKPVHFRWQKKWKGRVGSSKPILDWVMTEKWNICGK